MGRVSHALKKAGATKVEIDEYTKQSMSGDYNNLLRTVFDWVTVVDTDEEELD